MTNYIDTRDLATELDELETRQDAVADFVIELDADTDMDAAIAANDELEPLDEDEATRLAELRDLRDEVGPEWRYGVLLIPVDDFVEYAQEYADSIGAIDTSASWPLSHIDWDAAADDLASDFSETEWEGTAYYFRG